MERIDTPTAIGGLFVEADKTIGRKGTKVTAKWLNDLQESMVTLIEAAGMAPSAVVDQFRKAILSLVYPVGSVYIAYQADTSPATLFGIGTWVAFGGGRVPVGIDLGQTEFDAIGKTGGAKTHALTPAQGPKHFHRMRGPHSVTPPQGTAVGGVGNYGGGTPDDGVRDYPTFSAGGDAASGSASTGGGNGEAHSIMQPYIVVKMWRRTE